MNKDLTSIPTKHVLMLIAAVGGYFWFQFHQEQQIALASCAALDEVTGFRTNEPMVRTGTGVLDATIEVFLSAQATREALLALPTILYATQRCDTAGYPVE